MASEAFLFIAICFSGLPSEMQSDKSDCYDFNPPRFGRPRPKVSLVKLCFNAS